MAKLGISTGIVPNDGMGDSLLDGAIKINSNFNEIYNYFGNGTNLTAIGGTWVTTSAGIHTLKNVGVGTTNPTSTLTVGGNVTISGILTSSSAQLSLLSGTNSNYSGVSTVGSLRIGSNQVISSGRELQNITSLDSTTTATIESAIQSAPNNFNNLNVSGVSTLGNTVVGGATTQLIVNGDARITGILTIGSSSITLNGSSNTINVGSGITLNGSTGIISATSIFINGSQITGLGVTYITAGTGISVNQNTGNVTITATGGGGGGGESYWTSTAAGINTLSNVGVGTTNPTSALTVKGNTSLETLNVSGISTFNGRVSFGSSAIFRDSQMIILGDDGDLEIFHNGSSRAFIRNKHQNLEISSPIEIELQSPTKYYARFTESFGALLYDNNNQIRFQTLGTGVTVTGTTFTNQLNVSGVSTFRGNVQTDGSNIKLGDGNEGTGNQIRLGNGFGMFDSDLWIYHNSGYGNLLQDVTGTGVEIWTGEFKVGSDTQNSIIATLGDSVQLSYNTVKKFETLGTGVTITGTTFTNQLNVSGVSTLTSNVSVGGTINLDGGLKLTTNNPTIVGTSGTVGEIKRIGGAPFFYDGSAWREFVLSSGTPVSVPADTEWDNVVFRATFDTDFTDAKFGATPVYVSTGSSIVGSAVTIGTGAFRNDGGNVSGIGVSYAYRSDYDFTGSWTIEFWVYHDSTPLSLESLVSQVSTVNTSGNWSLGMFNNGFNISIYWANENSAATFRVLDVNAVTTWNSKYLQKWTHYALVREGDSGSLHLYINGVETSYTINDSVIDNNILHINGAGLGFGAAFGNGVPTINGNAWNNLYSIDAIFDDVRISCGVGTAGQRYNSIGISTYATFTPPTTALPTTGTLSSYVQPPGDKYGEIGLGTSPTWRGTSGVTVSQRSSGNYRVSFASSYTNYNDYFVLTQAMDQGFASYVGVARSTTHVDFAINKESDNSAVNTGSLSVQIKNHV